MEKKISFKDIWSALLKYKRLGIKVLVATFIIACFLTLCMPNYYNATVTLAPELSRSSSNTLSSLASSFGINMGGNTSGSSEAIFPTLYPEMMNSVEFKTSLFPIKVHEKDSNEEMTYYEYLLDHQREPWWSTIIGGTKKVVIGFIKSLFTDNEEEGSSTVNPFMLTKEQTDVIKYGINKRISCDVDQKTLVISISVTDQDPLIAAVMADSVKQRLQDAITDYRTSKARVDLEYNKKLFEETKRNYDDARQKYAVFADANQGMVLQSARSKLIELENDMQIKYQAYSSVAAQLQSAEAKVQQDTPAFTTICGATVPVEKDGPHRARIVIMLCFLAGLITCCYALHKEGFLIPLTRLALGLDGDKEESAKSE